MGSFMDNSPLNGAAPYTVSKDSDPLSLLDAQAPSQNPLSSTDSSLSFQMSKEEEHDMIRKTIEILEEYEEQEDKDDEMIDVDEEEEEEEEIDLEDQQRRTGSLGTVLGYLKPLWSSGSELLDLAAEKLADASRNPKWRIPMGDSNILSFFLEIASLHTLRHNLKVHVLRLIGNSCADTDENRARVISSDCFTSIINQLRDLSLIAFTIPVLYNICVDYEPAQLRGSNLFLSREIIELLVNPSFKESKAFLGYCCKILDLLVAHPCEIENASDKTAVVLLSMAADRGNPIDMDDFIALTNTASAYLKDEKFQRGLILEGAIALDTTLAILLDSYTRFDAQPSIGTPSSSVVDSDEYKLVTEMRSKFNQVLSEISALPEFRDAVPVVSLYTTSLRRWLTSPHLQLQVCACIMLGNLARSDSSCEDFVHVSGVHIPLIEVLSNAQDTQLLHAALGFLKNLALPAKNKKSIGEAGIFDILPRLWLLDTLQQIQFSAVSLTRQLINGTYENVRLCFTRLSKDKDSPANMRSNISLLIALFDRTDVEPIKMEISRLITSVFRVFNSYTGRTPEETANTRRKFFSMHPDVGRPLSFMVSQSKWPVVRSEGWFAFALMARSPEGAKCMSEITSDVAVFQPLVELLTGKTLSHYSPSGATSGTESTPETSTSTSPQTTSSSPQSAEMMNIDRENALVLVHELLKNRGDEMAVMRRVLLEDLLKGGTQVVQSFKEVKSGSGEVLLPASQRARAGLNLQEVSQQAFSEFG